MGRGLRDRGRAAARRPGGLLAGAAEQLPAEELTRRERSREMSGGIVGYAADDACGLLAFALSGQLWAARPADGRAPACGAPSR